MLALVYFSQGCNVTDGLYSVIMLPLLTIFYGGPLALWYVPYIAFAALPGYYGLKRAIQIEAALALLALITMTIDITTRHTNAAECLTQNSTF